MRNSRARKVTGSLAGVALLTFGASGLLVTNQQFQGPVVERLCRLGLCADEFSVRRVFLLKQQSQIPGNSDVVLPLLQRSLLEDNASGYKWTDLGAVEFDSGHEDQARYCFEQAVKAAPRSPVV